MKRGCWRRRSDGSKSSNVLYRPYSSKVRLLDLPKKRYHTVRKPRPRGEYATMGTFNSRQVSRRPSPKFSLLDHLLTRIYRPKTYLFQCLASKVNIQFARRQLSRAFLKRISPIPFNSEKSLAEFYLADFAQRLRITFRDPDVFELSLLAQLFQSPITLLQRTGYV